MIKSNPNRVDRRTSGQGCRRAPDERNAPMGGIGTPELLIVLLVVLLIFGGAKLPQLARSLGQAKNEFKRGEDDGVEHKPEPKL